MSRIGRMVFLGIVVAGLALPVGVVAQAGSAQVERPTQVEEKGGAVGQSGVANGKKLLDGSWKGGLADEPVPVRKSGAPKGLVALWLAFGALWVILGGLVMRAYGRLGVLRRDMDQLETRIDDLQQGE